LIFLHWNFHPRLSIQRAPESKTFPGTVSKSPSLPLHEGRRSDTPEQAPETGRMRIHPLCQSRLGRGYRQFWRCRKNFMVSQWRDKGSGGMNSGKKNQPIAGCVTDIKPAPAAPTDTHDKKDKKCLSFPAVQLGFQRLGLEGHKTDLRHPIGYDSHNEQENQIMEHGLHWDNLAPIVAK